MWRGLWHLVGNGIGRSIMVKSFVNVAKSSDCRLKALLM